MRQTLAILTLILAGVCAARPALADDDCLVPMADWQPREAVVRLAAEQGWTVRRIKIDDGCYEIKGSDAAGRPVEVTVHPATLQVLEIDYEDGNGARRRTGAQTGLDDD